MNLKPLFLAGYIAIGISQGNANASVILDITQTGPDVQIIGTGRIDLASVIGPVFDSHPTHDFNARNEGISSFYIGVFPISFFSYRIGNSSISGVMPTSNPYAENIGGDTTKGLFINSLSGGTLFTPSDYVSNAPLDFTAFISSYKLSDYGIKHGDFIKTTWSNNLVTESLTMNFYVIPEPSTALLALLPSLIMAYPRNRNDA